jgi:hypothetical protein
MDFPFSEKPSNLDRGNPGQNGQKQPKKRLISVISPKSLIFDSKTTIFEAEGLYLPC